MPLATHPARNTECSTLCRGVQTLTWPNHYINIRLTDMMVHADAAQDDNLELALRRVQDRAQQYFAVGWFDWHEGRVYIRNGKTFIYDPSCISWN